MLNVSVSSSCLIVHARSGLRLARLGDSEHAAYRGVRAAGLSMLRAMPRKYTAEEKDEFFRRLALNPNVSVVAKERGFPRVMCYAWAH